MEIREERGVTDYPAVPDNGLEILSQKRLPDELDDSPVIHRTSYGLPLLLFIATVFTTLLAGALQQGANPFRNPASLAAGIPFSFTLLAILLTHEFGHYFASKHHGVPATLPYFIPAPPIPFIIGTFGAFIRMKAPILRKKALLDIGAAGPIAGFIVTVPAIVIGLQLSEVVKISGKEGILLGNPLLFSILSHWVIGTPPDGFDVVLHPIAFAGWIGLLVTFLNLIPIGQLDGGHVGYAILGERQRYISMAMVGILVIMGFLAWPGWFLWAFLTTVLGTRHPPVIDGDSPLDTKSRLIGVTTLVIFILCFVPVPFQTF
jgi:membrane-associated protease RseP (regulator of RpoE activity)